MRASIGHALTVFLMLNVVSSVFGETAKEAENRREETQAVAIGYRHAINLTSDRYIHGIGSLSKLSYWTDVVPLTDDQKAVLWKLDRVVFEARKMSFQRDASYMERNPIDYKEYRSRCKTRRNISRSSGKGMVMYGLLTEAQGAFKTYRNLTEQSLGYALQGRYVSDLLQLTDEQRKQVRHSSAQDILDGFTDTQQKIWHALTAQPPALEFPELSAPAPFNETKLSQLSPAFRVLSDRAIDWEFSAEQEKLLRDLKEVTWIGLHWIKEHRTSGPYAKGDERNELADPAGQVSRLFLQLAEQVAVSGILTEHQEIVFEQLANRD